MRELTSHKVNGLNVLKIVVLDEPGAGNACHHYHVEWNINGQVCDACDVRFQNGPIAENGVNGLSNEALLAIVLDRITSFQAGNYADEWNADAMDHIEQAMSALKTRTLNRIKRGVEGTNRV